MAAHGYLWFFFAGLNFLLVRNPDREVPMVDVGSVPQLRTTHPTYIQLLVNRKLWLVGFGRSLPKF